MRDAIDPELAQAIILQHHRSPKRKRPKDDLDSSNESHLSMVNPACGDELCFILENREGDDATLEASYIGQGCAVSQAAASILASQLHGLDPREGKRLVESFLEMMSGSDPTPHDLCEELWAFSLVRANPARRFCAEMAAQLARGLLGGNRA